MDNNQQYQIGGIIVGSFKIPNDPSNIILDQLSIHDLIAFCRVHSSWHQHFLDYLYQKFFPIPSIPMNMRSFVERWSCRKILYKLLPDRNKRSLSIFDRIECAGNKKILYDMMAIAKEKKGQIPIPFIDAYMMFDWYLDEDWYQGKSGTLEEILNKLKNSTSLLITYGGEKFCPLITLDFGQQFYRIGTPADYPCITDRNFVNFLQKIRRGMVDRFHNEQEEDDDVFEDVEQQIAWDFKGDGGSREDEVIADDI